MLINQEIRQFLQHLLIYKMPFKNNNRKTTTLKRRIGPAGPATYKAKKAPMGKTAPSFKQLL